jgi:predicted ATP-grasp superfamily ATP-dependent carboligase
VLLVLGPEPSLRWKLFCQQIVGLAAEMGARLAVSMGALLADVPHSRPVQIIGTASDPELIDTYDLQRSRYEGPTGIVGVLHEAMSNAGIPTASLWAAVPQYAAQIPSPKAALALVERACRLIGSPAPADVFASGAAEYDARVAALIADDDDLVEYVSRLESLVDEEDDEPTGEIEVEDSIDPATVDPDELVAEVEQFLRDRRDEG